MNTTTYPAFRASPRTIWGKRYDTAEAIPLLNIEVNDPDCQASMDATLYKSEDAGYFLVGMGQPHSDIALNSPNGVIEIQEHEDGSETLYVSPLPPNEAEGLFRDAMHDKKTRADPIVIG